MAKKADFHCPKCGEQLSALLSKLQALEDDKAKLKRYLAAAQRELKHLGHSRFLASAKKKHFHKPNCTWAQYLNNSPNLLEFFSHREAEEAGYKPCKTCRA